MVRGELLSAAVGFAAGYVFGFDMFRMFTRWQRALARYLMLISLTIITAYVRIWVTGLLRTEPSDLYLIVGLVCVFLLKREWQRAR